MPVPANVARFPSPDSAEQLARALGGRRNGTDWIAPCPAHEDSTPSLAITDRNGRALVHCHAGCGQEAVVAALKARGLWPDAKPAASAAPHAIVAVYEYQNHDGHPAFEVVRCQPKTFKIRRPDGRGGYIWNKRGVELVPYRLPELIAAVQEGRVVFIVEGEKDCDGIRQLGLVATTNPFGAGKWRASYNQYFAGAKVVVLGDDDFAGHQHAQHVCAQLAAVAARVRFLVLPGGGKDASDWIARGGTREALAQIVGETPTWQPPEPGPAQRSDKQPNDDTGPPQTILFGRWDALGLDRTGKAGAPKSNLNNAAFVLERDDRYQGRIWYDEFLQRVLFRDAHGFEREWTDDDAAIAALYIQRHIGVSEMSPGTVWHAVVAVARQHPRHCVREWLDSLRWDDTPRLDDFFPDAFGAAKTVYTMTAGRKFVIGLVARVYRPGCKLDTMVVLEGPQGQKKSSALQQIVGGQWFAESAESPTRKDFFIALQGKLLVEVAEMDVFTRAEVSAVKRVLSCPSDRYRAPYDRSSRDWPRQGIFAGTTNKDEWLRDATGGRRFWPIRCTDINLAYIREQREQLFAEAVVKFKAGETWWDMPEEETAVEQEARREPDPWEPLVVAYVDTLPCTTYLGKEVVCVTTTQVLTDGLRIDAGRIDRSMQMRLATCLRLLGFAKGDAVIKGRTVKGWRRAVTSGECSDGSAGSGP